MKVSENDKILLKAKSLSEMRQKSIALYVFQKYLTSIMDSCALLRLTKSYNDGKKNCQLSSGNILILLPFPTPSRLLAALINVSYIVPWCVTPFMCAPKGW